MYMRRSNSLADFAEYAVTYAEASKDEPFYRIYNKDSTEYIDIAWNTIKNHIQIGAHPLTRNQWNFIEENLFNIITAGKSKKNGVGTVGTILARIGDNKQAAGVSIGVAQNGRLFLQSAFMNNTAKGYDAWIKDKSSHVLSAPKGPRNASSSLSISNIKDIFGFVNKDFHVTEGLPKTGFPYSMFFYKANTKANTNNTSGGATVQKNEPAGDYIMYDSAKGGTHRDGFKYGHITFSNTILHFRRIVLPRKITFKYSSMFFFLNEQSCKKEHRLFIRCSCILC